MNNYNIKLSYCFLYYIILLLCLGCNKKTPEPLEILFKTTVDNNVISFAITNKTEENLLISFPCYGSCYSKVLSPKWNKLKQKIITQINPILNSNDKQSKNILYKIDFSACDSERIAIDHFLKIIDSCLLAQQPLGRIKVLIDSKSLIEIRREPRLFGYDVSVHPSFGPSVGVFLEQDDKNFVLVCYSELGPIIEDRKIFSVEKSQQTNDKKLSESFDWNQIKKLLGLRKDWLEKQRNLCNLEDEFNPLTCLIEIEKSIVETNSCKNLFKLLTICDKIGFESVMIAITIKYDYDPKMKRIMIDSFDNNFNRQES